MGAGHSEIRELFDRIERIKSGQIDTSIPPGEAYTKAINRNRKWPSFPPPKD